MLKPLTLRDFGTIEQHLLSKRPNVLKQVAEAAKDLPDSMAKALIDRAYDDMKAGNTVSSQEVAAYMDTFDGIAFTIWISLRKDDDTVTLDEVTESLHAMNEADVSSIAADRDFVSGLDERGNSTGPAQK